MLRKKSKKTTTRNEAVFLYRGQSWSLSLILFHTVILKMLCKRSNNQEIRLRFYIVDKVGVPIIDSIPHWHSAIALIISKNKTFGYVSTERKKVECLASIVCLTVLLKMF